MFCSSSFPSDLKTVIVKLLVIHVLILLGIVGTPGLCVLVVINSVQHLVSDFFLLVFVLISFFFFFFHFPWNVLWYTGIWGQLSILVFSFEELSFCLALEMNRRGQSSLAFGEFFGWVSG